MSVREIRVGDVVQIDPAHDDVFGGCFMVVTEIKAWGVQGYVAIPGKGDKGGDAYYRVKFQDVELIGQSEWVRPSATNEDAVARDAE